MGRRLGRVVCGRLVVVALRVLGGEEPGVVAELRQGVTCTAEEIDILWRRRLPTVRQA